jgi:hypothetical protein
VSYIHEFTPVDVANTLFAFALLGAGGGGAQPSEVVVSGMSVQVCRHPLPGTRKHAYNCRASCWLPKAVAEEAVLLWLSRASAKMSLLRMQSCRASSC